ncbi:MAG: carbon storage regulator CsrA [Bacillota bacterium]
MLVLTRKPGESIVIGEDIEVKVISVDGEAIRLGVTAPRKVPVYRREIVEAIREENLRAARSAAKLGQDLNRLLKGQET